MIRILIADDHQIMREGLRQLFALYDDITVVGEASNGEQVFEALRAGNIDLLLLDMNMLGLSGSSLINRVCLLDNAPPILVLSMHNEPQVARSALAAGAAGYVTKNSGHEVLRKAICKVAAGGRFVEHDLAERMALGNSLNQTVLLHECLTGREMLIFRMIVNASNINDVALALNISNKTVSAHKANLMKKWALRAMLS